MVDYVKIGDATLYHGDCMDVLPQIKADILLTDPPYGIGEAAGKNASRGNLAVSVDYGDHDWDDSIALEEVNLAISKTSMQAIFGGNYYPLPPTKCWLIWDKINGKSDFADCEMIWSNLDMAVRLKRFMWNGMLRDGKPIQRQHPTQKPVEVIEWILSYMPAGIVCDPFMGSGSTGVACANFGRKFIGIEKDRRYFNIACERIEAAYAQGRLFA